jgi:hypothetical protein
MKPPISISADLEAGVVLVRYRRLPEGSYIVHDVQIASGATAGIDTDGNIEAIELLNLNTVTLSAAADYAHTHQLAFPTNLSHLLEAA